MASATQTVKKTAHVAEWLLKSLYEYLKRLITVNVPSKVTWLTDTYYPMAKGLVNHPTMYSGMNTELMSCIKAVVAGIMVGLAIGLVPVLLCTALVRSLWK
jgi:hypothetical protein